MITFKFHILFFLMAFLCGITGFFKNFIFLTLIIIVHELGHVLLARIFKWKIDRVVILPIGGITIFDEVISKSLLEEFFILIFGPLFQIIFVNLFFFIFGFNEFIYYYNLFLLFFNLLPIYPLDGYKLFNIFLNIIFSYRLSFIVSIILSFIFLLLSFLFLFFYYHNFILFIAFIILLFRNIKYLFSFKLIFNKFLLERYLYKFYFKKYKFINNVFNMKRTCLHIFNYKGNLIDEKDYLKGYFKKNM